MDEFRAWLHARILNRPESERVDLFSQGRTIEVLAILDHPDHDVHP